MGYEVVQQVTVDVSRALPAPVVYCKQADNVVRILQVLIQDNKEDYMIPAGFVARLRGTKGDGTRIYLDARSQTDNNAEFVLTQNALAAYGKATCEVELSNTNGETVKTCNLVLNVQQAALDDAAVESTDEFKSLDAARAAAENAAAKAESLAEKTSVDREQTNRDAQTAKAAAETAAGHAGAAAKSAASIVGAEEASAASAEAAKKSADDAAAAAKTAGDAATKAIEEGVADKLTQMESIQTDVKERQADVATKQQQVDAGVELARQAATANGYIQMGVDYDTGHLMYTRTTNLTDINFEIVNDTNLEVHING